MTHSLLPSALVGVASSARSLLPLALVSASSAGLSSDRDAYLSRPAVRIGLGVLALGELVGDKMRSAPDRTVPPGLIARAATGALAGGAVAPEGRRVSGAWLGAAVSIGMSFVTLKGRKRAMARVGQTRSGLFEDGLVLALALSAVGLTRGRK